ncbi:ATP-binding protein [Archangium sp.]|uniref:hybrid sensor histidine kinase/response regulator n=1 Tax=Archangium sp. TaxID=1872627 RepID=UPI00389AFF1A
MSGKISRLGSSSSAQVSGSEPARARILLVDDVPANLLALKAILEPLEQELVLAHSGDEALLALLQGDFACILMDVQMPGLTGLETAALIRERERTRHIPLLFITALSREAAYITRGYAQGAVDYLLKPVDPDILRSKVQVFVDLHVRGEQLKRQALEIAEHRRAQEEFLRAAELEQQLVGIVGHDIRTPLSVILATAQGQLALDELAPAQRRAFERVARGGERIQQIADLLLDFTRARLGGGIPVARRPGDLNELCWRMADEFQAARPRRILLCELSRNALQGEWDLERLAQVLANLLDNAFKYSPENTPVRLSTLEKDAESVFIEVHNQGAPIPGHLLPLLFEPFRRGEVPDTVRTSLGLGLYIAHDIVQSHGGSISVHSTAEAGTTFRVCLSRHARKPGRASPCQEGHEASWSETA